jgi:hypothetical protein
MRQFTEYLTEAFKKSSGKNVHLEHLEDEILNDGYAGFGRAMKSVQGVLNALGANEPSAYDITVKWDGAPAIVCGIDPQSGRFFVGTKSVFNVTPKLNFTNKDIDENHPQDGLNAKLKLALKHFSKLGISGVLQGDLLFDTDTVIREKIDGKPYLTFRANTITYAVEPESHLGKRIRAAKIGIVFHTAYEGDTMQTMTARFNPDISYLRSTSDVWFDNATLRVANGSGLFTISERASIEQSIAALTKRAELLKSVMNAIAANEGVKVAIKTYINGLVRTNMGSGHADANQLLAMMDDKAQLKRKKPSKKTTPSMDWIKKNRNQINQVFALHNAMAQLKLVIVHKLASLKGAVGTFVKDGSGYRVTAPEGYVAIDRMSNKAVKLVDRLDFSRSNFTVEKTWKKT